LPTSSDSTDCYASIDGLKIEEFGSLEDLREILRKQTTSNKGYSQKIRLEADGNGKAKSFLLRQKT
jgi:hypothetical protein